STASRPHAPDRSGSRTGRPCPQASPAPPSRGSPPAPSRLRSLASHQRWRPRRRRRSRQPGPPLRPEPISFASLAPMYTGCGCVLAALPHRGVENGYATVRCGGWDPIRVNEGRIWRRIWEVLHTVVADALGELEGRRLLLGAPLVAREPRWLQVLARAEGLLEHRGVRVHRRAVR